MHLRLRLLAGLRTEVALESLNVRDHGSVPNHGPVEVHLEVDDLGPRRRSDQLAGLLLLAATLVAAVPAIGIVGLLVVKGLPALSFEFLFSMPVNGMTAGGILPAIAGTVWLVGVSLAFAVPVGVLAGIYLSEYAGDGVLPRVVDLAIVNLAGVPSIVHALFGLGAFVLFLGFGTSILAAGSRCTCPWRALVYSRSSGRFEARARWMIGAIAFIVAESSPAGVCASSADPPAAMTPAAMRCRMRIIAAPR